jgi:VanZ like family
MGPGNNDRHVSETRNRRRVGALGLYRLCDDLADPAKFVHVTRLEHLAAFAFLGALFCLPYPRHIPLACLIVLGSALLLEIVQLLTPDRHGRIQDAIEKIAGGVVGIAAARAILSFEQANRWFQN